MCVSVCLSVSPETSETASRIATLFPPTQRASPGELHELLSERMRRPVPEKKFLKVSRWLRFDGLAFSVTLPVTRRKI